MAETAGKRVDFHVGMTCNGCANACRRILSKFEGVTDIATDVENKSIAVTCAESVSAEEMLEALKKWAAASGKAVELVGETPL